jgi:hypothetical protein
LIRPYHSNPETIMEIRNQSKAGPLVPPLADLPAKLSQQIEAVKQQWLDQLNRDPACFARLEVEIHDHFRRLADQATASLLAEAATPQDQAEPGKKGTPPRPIDRDAHRRRGG